MLAANPPASVTFGTGESSATLTVATDDDAVVEAASTVTAAIASGAGYSAASGAGSAQVSVEDNDAATFTVSFDAEAIAEGQAATLTVAIANGVTFAEDQTIALDFAGGTAEKGTDYTVSSESVILTAGSASVRATVTAVDDTDTETAETVAVAARHEEAAIGSASVTIEASDAVLPEISIAAGASPVAEGTAAAFTLTRTGPTAEALTVAVSVTESGAMLAANPPASVTFGTGESSATLTVATDDDAVVEAASTVTAAIASGAGYSAASGAGSAQVSVEDNDAATFTVSFDAEAIAEGQAATLTVAIANGVTFAEDQTIALDFAGGTAEKVTDYTVSSESVILTAGSASVRAMVTAVDDTDTETAETVAVTARHGVAAIGSATITIEASDTVLPAISMAAGTSPITEGTAAAFTLTRTGPTTEVLAVAVSVTESGAMLAANPPASVTFGADESSATLTAATDDDAVVEAASTVTAAIASGEGYSAASGAGSAQLSVEDNDAATFTVSFDAEAIAEGQAATLTVAIANGVTFAEDQTIALDFAGGTAEKGTDYTVSFESVILTAGSASVRATVTAVDDTDTETAETVAVAARHGEAAIGSASVTIEASDAVLPEISIAAGTSPVAEGTAAGFTLTRTGSTTEALTVAVSVTESGAMLAANPPASVRLGIGETTATLSVPTEGDSVVEADSTVTAMVATGVGYTVGTTVSAAVTVEDDDAATFTVAAAPEAIAEGESATLTVAISNGVTFAEDQTVALSLSGTASAADYAGLPAALTLQAGASATTAGLTASEDQEDEELETVVAAASHGGVAIGTATVTIRSVSHDATLAALSLSGVDIGSFASDKTAYAGSVGTGVSSTTVTATAAHSKASVAIQPGAEVSLAEGANEITVTVTAEDGTTRKAYTVTVTRAAPVVVSIAAEAERVSEADLARFTVSRTGPTTEPLAVQALYESNRSERRRSVTVEFARGQRSVTRRVQVGDNTIVEDDVTVTWTLQAGEGYTVSSENATATVVLEENDVPEFAVTVEPAEIAEGGSATVRVAITNGVRFRQTQTIALAVSGTASASDYTGVPATLSLPAWRTQARTATLEAATDQEEETDETVTITASHGGAAIGTATVTITGTGAALSDDATLSGLALSGSDIGTFASRTTAYTATVAEGVSSTTVTATPNDAEATVTIADADGSTAGTTRTTSLALGETEIRITVTAADGQTTAAYTVTVTREYTAPAASIAAGTTPVTEGAVAVFTVSLDKPAAEALTVAVSVTETGEALGVRDALDGGAGEGREQRDAELGDGE